MNPDSVEGLSPDFFPATLRNTSLEGLSDVKARQKQFIQNAYQQHQRLLYTPDDIDILIREGNLPDTMKPLSDALHWLRGFIMRPHPNLGRTGAVCPFVKPAIEEALLCLSIAQPADPTDPTALTNELNLYRDIFHTMEPFDGPLAPLRVIMLLLPDTPVPLLSGPLWIKTLKTNLMAQGITMGQFFPYQDEKALLASKFFPVQSPCPMYAMRTFIPEDWMFINREKEWRDVYLAKFGAPPQTVKK